MTRTETVTATGLDLTASAGVGQMHRRVLLAAERACRMDGQDDDSFRLCVGRAVQGTHVWAATRIAEAGTTEVARAAVPFRRPAPSADTFADR